MPDYKVQLNWRRDSPDFSHDSFNRNHQITFSCGVSLEASSAPEFTGDPGKANPEEMYLASLASCHILTFLAIAAKSRYVLDRYEDAPVATLEKNDEGRMVVSRVVLRPRVAFSGDKIPDEEKIKVLHEKAHKYCFIANSVRSEIIVEPQG